MKKGRVLRYFILMFIIIFVLLFINIFIRAFIFINNYKDRMPQRANTVKNQLDISENGDVYLNEETIKEIEAKNEFAMLISKDGDVVWSVNKPEEVPDKYSISQVAAFSHWYLKDYPVYTAIMNESILVVGEPKDSVWRFNITYELSEMNSLLRIFPFVIIADILLAIFIPLIILSIQEKANEKERVQWISGVSHDIRTPLSIILGNAQDIMNAAEKEGPNDVYAKTKLIKSQTLRIRELITNLNTENVLSFGIRRSGEELNLPMLIRDTVCSVMEQDEDGAFDVELDVSGELENTKVKADEGLIKRLITNLLINSMAHNPDGCSINISLRSAGAREAVLIIRDDGVGADAETINRLNHKNYAVGLSEHGLGLAVVKKIASLYRWRISFASDIGFITIINMQL